MQLLKQLCTSYVGHNDRKHKQVTAASLWVCINRRENFLAFQNKTWHGLFMAMESLMSHTLQRHNLNC